MQNDGKQTYALVIHKCGTTVNAVIFVYMLSFMFTKSPIKTIPEINHGYCAKERHNCNQKKKYCLRKSYSENKWETDVRAHSPITLNVGIKLFASISVFHLPLQINYSHWIIVEMELFLCRININCGQNTFTVFIFSLSLACSFGHFFLLPFCICYSVFSLLFIYSVDLFM